MSWFGKDDGSGEGKLKRNANGLSRREFIKRTGATVTAVGTTAVVGNVVAEEVMKEVSRPGEIIPYDGQPPIIMPRQHFPKSDGPGLIRLIRQYDIYVDAIRARYDCMTRDEGGKIERHHCEFMVYDENDMEGLVEQKKMVIRQFKERVPIGGAMIRGLEYAPGLPQTFSKHHKSFCVFIA